MELRQWDRLFLKCLLLCAAGIVVAAVLGLDLLTSYLFMATFPLTVILWGRSVRKTLTAMDLLMMLTATLAVISVIINVWIAGGALYFDYFRKLIMFIMTLMFFQTAYRLRVDREIVRFMDRIVDLLTIFLVVMYILQPMQAHMLNGRLTRYLTFGFNNPNTTGLFLTCLFMMEMYRLFKKEKWYMKTLHILMACVLIWFVVETQSRNCLLVLAMFVAVCIWLRFRSTRALQITRFWSVVIAWFPLLFALLYMLFIYSPWIQNALSFIVDVGKELDSRTKIWTIALENIRQSPLIGDYFGISNGTGNSQLHNSHLDIMASYGIPILVMVCTALSTYLYQKGRIYEDKQSYIYILAFTCAIMLGIGEAALFSGGLGIYIFVGAFLMLSNAKSEEEEV